MQITRLTADLNNVQALTDRPNSNEGLTADQLKAVFDRTGNQIKDYINGTMLPQIESSAGMNVDIVSLKDYGAIGDGVTNDTAALVSFIARINDLGSHVYAKIPPGTYIFSPDYDGASEWRELIELVDVTNVIIDGYGAVLKQVKDPSWTAGGTPANQEGPIQFRSSGDGTCNNIAVLGLTIEGDNVPYDALTGDGSCMGISLRGVHDAKIKDCTCTGWGTDGIYVGTTYSNTYKSKNVTIDNATLDGNTRQGISIAGADNTTIINPIISNTGGGSFGHAIDFEANSPQYNIGGKVIGGSTYNNERGAINFIRSQNIKVIGMDINEPDSTGSIYCDGDVENISVSECTIVSDVATLYFNGENIENFKFHDNTCTTLNKPNNNATIRINFAGTATDINNIVIRGNKFYGTGGLYCKFDGKMYFEDNLLDVSLQDSSNADCFGIVSDSTGAMYFNRNHISINSDVVFSEKRAVILHGHMHDNELISHTNAKMYVYDDRQDASADITIGYNLFSTNFYYKGESGTGLNIATPGFASIPVTGGVTAVMRFVHGGITRVTNGASAKVGDVTLNRINTTSAVAYGCLTAGSPGTWVLCAQHVRKGSTGGRPSPSTYDQGMMYMDTTLDADGLPIMWNGTKWLKMDGTDA